MKQPRILHCDHCGAPVQFESPFCAHCRSLLRWGAMLDVEPGEPLIALDLSHQPLPAGRELDKHVRNSGDGVLLSFDHGSFFGSLPQKLADACVSVSAVVSSENTGFGVTGRLHHAGAASSGYSLMVNPSARSYRVQRILWTKQRNYIDTLRDWEVSPHLGGLGALNRVELRYADSILQVVLNGARVASLVDARLGFGAMGWRATAYDDLPQGKSILFRSLEVRRVA